jgi:hypothetical protein
MAFIGCWISEILGGLLTGGRVPQVNFLGCIETTGNITRYPKFSPQWFAGMANLLDMNAEIASVAALLLVVIFMISLLCPLI